MQLRNKNYMNNCTTTPFTKDFFFKHQPKLLWLANTSMGRKLLCIDEKLPKIMAILPNSVHWEVSTPKRGKQVYGFEYRTHNKYAKVLQHRFYYIWKAMHEFDMNFANLLQPKWNLGFDSFGPFYPDAHPETTTVDGDVGRNAVNETWGNIRAGAGNYVDDSSASSYMSLVSSSTTTNQFATLLRNFWLFDTASIPDSAIISATTLSLCAAGAAVNSFAGTAYEIDVVSSTPASNTALANGDYQNIGATVFCSIAFASLAASGSYNDFVLNSNGIANVSKTGVSKFSTRINWDTDNNFTGTWGSSKNAYQIVYTADASGTSTDPKLTGTYTIPVSNNAFFALFNR